MTDSSSNPPGTGRDILQKALAGESYAGEVRVNLIRLAAILCFYLQHLTNYYLLKDDASITESYHQTISMVVLGWSALTIFLYYTLGRGKPPQWLAFAAVSVDFLMAFMLTALSGGPRSALIFVLPLIVVSSGLRQRLSLVYFATAAGLVTYLSLLANYAWFQVGLAQYYATPSLRVPRSEQFICSLSLLVCGLLAGQSVRQSHRIAQALRSAGICDDGGAQ